MRAHGVKKLFTLSGGHLFSIYDGCRSEGVDLVDVRHEQTAAFAAEGWSKVTREVGVCALTAGPGVTNGMSALASAAQNGSPMLTLAGRAPQLRWGQGSLQEIDHLPFVSPLVKSAATALSPEQIQALVDDGFAAALAPPSGPAFVDFPLDVVFAEAQAGEAPPEPSVASPEPSVASPAPSVASPAPDGAELERAGALLRAAERPVIMAGTGLYWSRGEDALRALAEELRIPVFLNGLARGCLPADHELFFSRARAAGLGGADVALVVGVPLDFRLGFGGAFAPEAQLVVIDAAVPERRHPRQVAAECYGEVSAALTALRDLSRGAVPARETWLSTLRQSERERREGEAAMLADPRAPLHPMRIYGELASVLDRDAIVVVDGGDFGSFAGRVIESFEPGCWVDPGPYGCLGSGPGYALAAKLARPERQVVLLLGDGAFGFAGMELDTLARHGAEVVAIVGNNGIWALEKHPMEALYGYSVAAELRPGTRYDQVAEALGCHGELVSTPDELRPALERAFSCGAPALINVLTDPQVAYPRRSSLA